MIGLISIQAIELLFVLVAMLGFVFSLLNLKRGVRLVRHLKQMGLTNGRMRLAKFGRNQEAARALIQGIFIFVGTTAFFLPPGTNEGLPTSFIIASSAIRYGLIAVAMIISWKSYQQWNFQRTFKLDQPSSNLDDV